MFLRKNILGDYTISLDHWSNEIGSIGFSS